MANENMTTTALWVFEKAMYLMDEQNESNGATDTADTAEYKFRSLPILNVLRHEVYPCSEYFQADGVTRPFCPEIASLDSVIQMEDPLVQGVMPYGLAARLLADENPTLANYFQQNYEVMLQTMRSRLPAVSAPIENLYGGMEHREYGLWT